MTGPAWRRMWRIFHDASELDPAERRAHLDAACAGDDALRAEIEQLLAAHESGAELLDVGAIPAAAVAWPDAEPLAAGERIGRWVVREMLGAGGFAEVYRAEQTEPIDREVALKIIKLGMDTSEVISRFRIEQQALAVMDHPHIAKVFDAGVTDAGRPFFVMELVPGATITAFCDEHRFDVTRRLRLFQDVCDAVQHAHHKGLIHRDLKPSNVLVSGPASRPVVKVIDFGIAKAIDPPSGGTVATRAGQLVGTPAYMSPEQADPAGVDVDTRSDVYSLGVLLYELLTGTTPFDETALQAAGPSGVSRLICEVEPPKPSTRLGSRGAHLADAARSRGTDPRTLARSMRGELDWIVMMALEKDRARRYETVDALARDVERHLRDEPVLAAAPSAGYRLRKFVRRHRVGVAAGATAMSALLAGLALAVTGFIAAARDRDELQAALETATRQTRIAEAVSTFLQRDLLAPADPMNAPDRDLTVRALLDRTSSEIVEAFPGEPLVEASIRTTLGVTYRGLGEHEAAARHLDVALSILRSEHGDDHPAILESLLPLAWVYWYLGEYARAEALWTEALPMSRRWLGEDHPDTLHAMAGLAALYNYQGRFEEARPLHRETVERCRRVLGDEHRDTLTAMHNLAWMDDQLGRHRDAERRYLTILETRRRIIGRDHPQTLVTQSSLAACYRAQRRYEEAERLHAEVLRTSREVLGREHPTTLRRMGQLAALYVVQGRHALAAPLLAEALERQRALFGHDHRDTQYTVSVLAQHHLEQGQGAEAEAVLLDLVERQERLFGSASTTVLTNLHRLALAYGQQGRHEEASVVWERVLDGQVATLGRESPKTLATVARLADALLRSQRPARAEPLFREALSGHEATLGRAHRRTFEDLRGLAVSLIEQAKLEAADAVIADMDGRYGRAPARDAAARRASLHEAWRRNAGTDGPP